MRYSHTQRVRRLALGLVAVLVLAAGLVLVTSSQDSAHGDAAHDDLDHDYGTVYVSPHSEQPAALRHVDACATDEGSDGQGSRPCVWDSRHLGNGLGHSFIVRRDGRISRISHARAHAFIWGGK